MLFLRLRHQLKFLLGLELEVEDVEGAQQAQNYLRPRQSQDVANETLLSTSDSLYLKLMLRLTKLKRVSEADFTDGNVGNLASKIPISIDVARY